MTLKDDEQRTRDRYETQRIFARAGYLGDALEKRLKQINEEERLAISAMRSVSGQDEVETLYTQSGTQKRHYELKGYNPNSSHKGQNIKRKKKDSNQDEDEGLTWHDE